MIKAEAEGSTFPSASAFDEKISTRSIYDKVHLAGYR